MKRLAVLLIFFTLLTACASFSTQGETVLLTTNPEKIEGCKFMGQVVSSPTLVNVRAGGVAFDNARHTLKSEAKQMGANVVFTSRISNKMGEAYKCN